MVEGSNTDHSGVTSYLGCRKEVKLLNNESNKWLI